MARDPQLDFQVAFCSLRGASAAYDPGFATEVRWDVPLLDGYPWREVRDTRGLKTLIEQGRFDAVVSYLNYRSPAFRTARRAAKSSGAAFLFGTDAHQLEPADGRRWKIIAKKLFWPRLFRSADQVIVPSSATRAMIASLGIPADRITLTPYSVDNAWWKARSAEIDRNAVRASWGIAPEQKVVLFCAKLQPWKRPADLLQAFSRANLPGAALVYAGEGPLRPVLEAEASRLGVASRVKFLGFVNQSGLPAVYTASDLLVLPSGYEPFGVVVNEAMCCGCPVVVSDRVGAAADLVRPVRDDFVYPSGDVAALARVLVAAFADPQRLRQTAQAAALHVERNAPEKAVAATIAAARAASERIGHVRSS